MALYPSCLYNRTQEARRHLTNTRRTGADFSGYPYHIVDLSVRMRPIVQEIDKIRKTNLEINLVKFERSRSFSTNDRYLRRSKVGIWVVLGAVIHERYIHVGSTEGDEKTIRLDVMSDKGRWIVNFYEFLYGLESYLMTRDEIAIIVCDMVDAYRSLVANDEPKYRKVPPQFGNFDLDWLLWDYVTPELGLKRIFMNEIFERIDIPDHVLIKVRFNANEIAYNEFMLYVGPHETLGKNGDWKKAVSWTTLSETVRRYINLK
ncbi:MAG: hypothetical protein OXI22_23200 [Defluviicoccus sp.]|nr:hypothetical protein [Defluviicoccus sp.]